jgi:hypothetical protein
MIEKPNRDDLATLFGVVRVRLLGALILIITILGIVAEGFSIYNGYLQTMINQAELPKRRAESCSARLKALTDFMSLHDAERGKPDEVKKLEVECNPYTLAEEQKETLPPSAMLDVREQIDNSRCYQSLRKLSPATPAEELRAEALEECVALAGLKAKTGGKLPPAR